jgi:hypothetical protein
MGEEMKHFQVFVDGKPVGFGTADFSISDQPEEETAEHWTGGYELTGTGTVQVNSREAQELMQMLSQSIRFDRKTIKKMFHAVTHHKQIWFDVVTEFKNGTINDGGVIVQTPHELRFLLNKIYHIRTPYRIEERKKNLNNS